MKRKLVNNLSANTLQLIVNQLAALFIFYILSTGLDKNSFGEINLVLALLLAIFNILSFGIDQIAVRRIASGQDPQLILSLYLTHVLLTGLTFYALLLFSRYLFPSSVSYINLLLLIGAGKLAIYFATPFKQSAVGMERFKLLARMSVVSNMLRAIILLALSFAHHISLQSVIIVFISGDIVELLAGIIFFSRNTKLSLHIKWSKGMYTALLKESFPQFGVVIITSALARFDWVFIGITVSAVSLAEYSFAYKVFELSTLPLLAIAPLLIPWFTRLFKNGEQNTDNLKRLARIELVIAAFTIVLLNCCWSPVIDHLTSGKYGRVNEYTIFILSLCIPLQYLTNFLWTIAFAKARLKMILTAFTITLSVNVLADIILIPIYKNEGAAFGYLAGYIAQTAFYLKKNDIKGFNKLLYPFFICVACACVSVFLPKIIFTDILLISVAPPLLYAFLILITMQLRLTDIRNLRAITDTN